MCLAGFGSTVVRRVPGEIDDASNSLIDPLVELDTLPVEER